MATKTTTTTDTETGFFRTLFGVKSFREAGHHILKPLRDRHAKHYRDSYFHFWADLLLLCILIGLLVIIIWLLVWQPKPAFSLVIESGSPHILSGEVETFSIDYENREDGTAQNTEILLNFPKNFIFLEALPAESYSTDSNTFKIGDLKKKDKGSVSIKGIVRAQPGDHQAIEVTTRYQYQGGNKKLLDSLSYVIDGSVLELQVSVPEQAYKDNYFAGNVVVKNTGKSKLSDIYLSFPSSDVQVNTDSTEPNQEIYFSEINTGETKQFDIYLTTKNTGPLNLSTLVALKVGDLYLKQKTITKIISVAEPQLIGFASLSPNAVSGASPFTTLALSITNVENQKLENVSFTLVPDRGDVSIKNIFSKSDKATVRGDTLLLGDLEPNQKQEIKADIEVQRTVVQLNDSVKMNIQVAYSLNNTQYEYTFSTLRLLFSSNLTINSGGYYYGPQGDQLGVGPIPPQVDIPTTYWIIWQVNNLGNDIQDLEVSADLPANIVWTDQQSISSGSLDYSPVTRRVLWRPGSIAKGGGNFRASFAVSLVPQLSDIGTVPILLNNLQFTGQDLFTKEQITRNLPEITANIENDKLSGGKGKVVPTE